MEAANEIKPFWSTITGITLLDLVSGMLQPKSYNSSVVPMDVAKVMLQNRCVPVKFMLDDGGTIEVVIASIRADKSGYTFEGVISDPKALFDIEVKGFTDGKSGYVGMM